jgi:PleD family two-component response regulator
MHMDYSDFEDQRVLLVGAKTHGLAVLRAVLGLAGVSRITQVEQPGQALKILGTDRFAAVFCEQACQVGDMPFALAARRKPSVLDPAVAIFVLKEQARRRDVEKARDLGATDVLTVPISPRTVIDKLNAAIHAPRPFIVAPDFCGPDRRGRTRKTFGGPERRAREPRKLRVDFTLV